MLVAAGAYARLLVKAEEVQRAREILQELGLPIKKDQLRISVRWIAGYVVISKSTLSISLYTHSGTLGESILS